MIDIKNKVVSRLFEKEYIVISVRNSNETLEKSGVFKGGVYLCKLPKQAKKATETVVAEVYEMIGDATFAELFGSFGENRLRWKECQVVQFCREHRDKIRVGSYVTLFELEGCYVVGVLIDDDNRLRAYVRSVTNPTIWQAYYRRRLIILF